MRDVAKLRELAFEVREDWYGNDEVPGGTRHVHSPEARDVARELLAALDVVEAAVHYDHIDQSRSSDYEDLCAAESKVLAAVRKWREGT